MNKLGVLIVRKAADQQCTKYAKEMINILADHTVYTEDDCGIPYQSQSVDMMITVGGDGTILNAARQFQKSDTPPMLTFGKGTLAFMCTYNLVNYRDVIQRAMTVPHTLEFKRRIKAELNGKLIYTALNDFFITKGNSLHVLTLDIFINDVFITQTKGDGLIIATPTGSTGYSLSAGGPIIHNSVPCILIAPICPLSLSFRPVVTPSNVKIKIKLNKESRGEGLVVCDGQEQHNFARDDVLEITQSEHNVRFIVPEHNFVEDWGTRLQKMLNWNSRFQQWNKD